MIDHDKVKSLLKAKEELDSNLKIVLESLKDTSVPLDERWDVYKVLVKKNIIIETESYGDGFIESFLESSSGRELTPYDDFYIERYETTSYTSLWDRIKDRVDQDVITAESADRWREKVLASGQAGFRYDW